MYEIVVELLSAKLGIRKSDISKNSDLIKDLHCDSLTMVELSLAFQDELGIAEIPDEMLAEIHTVNDLVQCAEKMVKK